MSTASPTTDARESLNVFAHEILVESKHIDRFGHANNVVILQWIQDVAEAHTASVGFPLSAYERLGAAFVVRHHEIDYLRPAVRGERLLVRTWVDAARSASCSRGTEITSVEDGHVVAKAMTTWVFAELATLRLTRIPDDVRIAFGFVARRQSKSKASNDSALEPRTSSAPCGEE